MRDRCLIIAEAGVNHNGRLELAYQLCDAAKDAGADVVKFQTWKTENLITKNVAQAEYQRQNTGQSESQFDMLKKLELSYDDFQKLKEYCDRIGIVFASTADEEESLDFLISLDIPFIKVGSGDIGNVHFLRYIGSKKKPVILSTGMSTIEDVNLSIQALKESGASDISLLHCTTSYPCAYEDVNLKAMLTLRQAFHLPVGFSDHTIGNDAAVAAVALGAAVVEKHFTLDCGMPGPDHKASTEPEAFRQLVHSIRNVEACLGSGEKVPTVKEREIAKVVMKRVVARRIILKGSVFREEDLCIKRNDTGIPARFWDECIGKKAIKDISVDEGIILPDR